MSEELPIPVGWFGLGRSADLLPGAVRPVRRFGQEWVLARSATGRPMLLDAWCPHLGAHLGHGGRVEGETVVCPFHGFRFDASGRCVATGYGKKVPRDADIGSLPVVERNGLLLAWHHPDGEAPSFEIPQLDTGGWSPVIMERLRLRTHPQETSENSVDLGHLAIVHGYWDLAVLDPVQVEGPHLTIRYRMKRRSPVAIPGFPALDVDFRVHVYGLGYSVVEVDASRFGFFARSFVLAAPEERRGVELQLATSVRLSVTRGLPVAAREALATMINPIALRALVHDVLQDKAIWENKRYEPRPRIADGDGPLGRYRQYVRQFYPASTAA